MFLLFMLGMCFFIMKLCIEIVILVFQLIIGFFCWLADTISF